MNQTGTGLALAAALALCASLLILQGNTDIQVDPDDAPRGHHRGRGSS